MGPLRWFQQREAGYLTVSPTEALYLTALLCYFKTNEPRPQELTACLPPAIEICGLSVLSSLQISVAAYSLLLGIFFQTSAQGKRHVCTCVCVCLSLQEQSPNGTILSDAP